MANGFSQIGSGINGEADGDHSGWFISISSDGNRIAIGATLNDANGSCSGHVRVYEWIGASLTRLEATLTAKRKDVSILGCPQPCLRTVQLPSEDMAKDFPYSSPYPAVSPSPLSLPSWIH